MFQDTLHMLNIEPYEYLDIARERASNEGYDPLLLHFSNDDTKKLSYAGIDFGSSRHKDFIIYAITEPEIANKKRDNYWKRAELTARKTNSKYSPATLALRILW